MKNSLYLLVIISAAIIIYGCGSKSNENEEKHEEHAENTKVTLSQDKISEIGLTAKNLEPQEFSGNILLPAVVVPNQDNEAVVGTLIAGRVSKVFAKVGDYVKAGQLLMQIEGLEIGEIKSGFLKAKANLKFYEQNYERQKTLFEQKAGSQKSLLEAQAEYEKALAEYNAEDKKIHSIGLSDSDILNYAGSSNEHNAGTLSVKAPVSGTVIERNIVTGQFVDASFNCFKILNTSTVWVDAQASENDALLLKQNQIVEFIASTNKSQISKGKISYIASVINEQTRTVTVRAEFNNNSGILKPQMFGELAIPVKGNNLALVVPDESIISIEGKNYLFIQLNDSTFEKREVIPGISNNGQTSIAKGINKDDKVVIKGAFYLKSELMKSELEEEGH